MVNNPVRFNALLYNKHNHTTHSALESQLELIVRLCTHQSKISLKKGGSLFFYGKTMLYTTNYTYYNMPPTSVLVNRFC